MTVVTLRLGERLSFHYLSIYCWVTHSLALKTAAIVLTALVSILWAVAFNLLLEGKGNLLCFVLVLWFSSMSQEAPFLNQEMGNDCFWGFHDYMSFFLQKARSQAEKKLCTVEPMFQFPIGLVPILNGSAFSSGS